MVQNPKGGGLSSSFGGGGTQQLGGVKKTGDFLDKSTWFLATALIVLILVSNLTIDSGIKTESKALDADEATEMPVLPSTDNSATTNDTIGG
jgi:preprotein translocase subunit SecG